MIWQEVFCRIRLSGMVTDKVADGLGRLWRPSGHIPLETYSLFSYR